MISKIVRFFLLFSFSVSAMGLESLSGSYQKHHDTQKVSDHWVILGAIERIKGAIKPEGEVRLAGRLSSWLWKMPVGHDIDESFGFIRKQIEDSAITLFDCEGRACGLSNDFANRVFSQSILYGRDSAQKYWVGLESGKQDTLWLIYGGQRSNQKVYLYAEKLVLNKGEVDLLGEYASKGELKTFIDRGYMVMQDLGGAPAKLTEDQVDKAKKILQAFPTQKFALVVHRYNKTENQRLVEDTQQEAQQLLDQIAKAGGFIQHLYAHGAGAMLPREGQANRIEMVELKSR
jgi:hypothetical protein